MSLLDRLEPKLARFSIQHLPVALVAAWAIAFVLTLGNPELPYMLALDPELVLQGQVWRLVTFLLLPPVTPTPGSLTDGIWLFFACYLFWLFGGALERQWGTFRFNVYLLVGWLLSAGACMLVPFLPPSLFGAGALGTNSWWTLSVFLAFAVLFPNFELLLFFILPVKVKWLALIAWIGFGAILLFGDWVSKLLAVASLANFFLFFTPAIVNRLRRGQRAMSNQVREIKESGTPFHTCHVCGVTDLKDPDRVFRVDTSSEGSPDICLPCLETRKAAAASD